MSLPLQLESVCFHRFHLFILYIIKYNPGPFKINSSNELLQLKK